MAVPSKRQMAEALQKRQQKEQTFYRRGSSLFISSVEGLKYYKTPDNSNLIDILPYIAGPNDPIGSGEVAHKLVIYIHPKLSQAGEDIICIERTFKGTRGKCPACEEYRRRVDAGKSDEEIKPFKVASWPRVLYNVYDRKNPANGVQVWNASSYLFQQYLDVIQRKSSLDPNQPAENFIGFMDPSLDGKSIAFDKQGKEEMTKYIGIHFEDRSTPVPDAIVEKAHVLDEIVAWPTYAQVYEDIFGIPYKTDSAVDVRQSKYGNQDSQEGVNATNQEIQQKDESEEDREQRELEEKFAKMKAEKEKKQRGGKKSKKEDPPEQKKEEREAESSSVGKGGCPSGHVFGVDIDEKPECGKCDPNIWKQCAKEADRIGREGRA